MIRTQNKTQHEVPLIRTFLPKLLVLHVLLGAQVSPGNDTSKIQTDRGSTCSTLMQSQRLLQYLKQPDEENREANGLHDASVVVHQGLLATLPPQVELLALLVVVKMGQGVADLVLDAGPWREGAAAAKWNAVHQVLPIHVAPQAAAVERRDFRHTEHHNPSKDIMEELLLNFTQTLTLMSTRTLELSSFLL